MARTLTATEEAQRLLRGVNGVWLVKATIDQYGIATLTKRYASRALTLSGNPWADKLVRGGLQLQASELKRDGGLCPIPSFTVRIRDEAGDSDASATHTLSGDEVILYWLFYTAGIVEGDLIELVRGVIEKDKVQGQEWVWQIKDGSTQNFRAIPADTLNPTTYPFAWVPGAPVPECWGNLELIPRTYPSMPLLAPAHVTNKWALECTGSLHGDQGPVPALYAWQWYSSARAWAQHLYCTSLGGGLVAVSDPRRRMWLYASRAHADNTVTDWYRAVGDDADYCTLGVGETFRVYLTGSSKLGTLTNLLVLITGDPSAPGPYTATLYDDTSVLGTASGSGEQTISFDFSAYIEWDISLFNVKVVATGAVPVNISNVYADVRFDDFISFSDSEPQLFIEQQGWRDLAAYYRDGAVVYSNNAVLRCPVHQIAAILRASSLMNLPTAQVSGTYISAAYAYRSSWLFDWWMDPDAQQREDLLDRLAFDAGLWLFKKTGQWRVVARDATRPPTFFILGHYHCPVAGGRTVPPFEDDWDCEPLPDSDIYNEVAIRYKCHPATGEHRGLTASSGMYRLTGTCTLDLATATLTDLSATFQTDGVIEQSADGPGERIYVAEDITYEVLTVTSQTELVVTPVEGGPVSNKTGATYYLGPNIDGICNVSQRSYKVTNALGGERQQTFLEEGGYRTDFVWDDDTAELMRDYFVQWGAAKRWRISFPLSHHGTLLEEGDVFLLDHERLPGHLQGVTLGTLAEAIDTSETTWDVDYPAAFRVDDYVYVQSGRAAPPECVKVTVRNVAGGTITVTRAQLGTAAVAHDNGDSVVRVIDWKWVVMSMKAPTPDEPTWRVEAELMPKDYWPQGTASPSGWPVWGAASASQRLRSGWSALRNTRVVDNELYSDVSFVGPDTGTYPV